MQDNHENRQFNMPYPLYDISTIGSNDIDRASEYEVYIFRNSIKLSSISIYKLRKHNPLDTCIASSYVLLRAICK